ncbi:hypothetical protein [Amycolatopsis taiwanensis]|uniref:hypothetical protein n=1 Tax=Amycolatopsis taiwanensis TaxID=342230 RepID=UPI0006933F1A|nr:hypothetical protein [Amycolatopsis taiwanensis]
MTAPQAPKTYGDEHKTVDEIAAMSDGERQQYLDQRISPQERDAYLHDSENAKYADMPWFGRIIADAKAGEESKKYSQQSAQQATSADTQYVTGLSPSNTNYKAIDHAELQGYVDNGLNAGQIGTMSNGYHDMAGAFDRIANAFNDAVNKSQSKWEGDAADSARGFFTSMQQWADGNAQNARLASEVTYQQSTAAQTAKNSMPAPVPFSWADEMKSWASNPNPFTIVDQIQQSQQKAQQSAQAHDQAAQVMSTYDNSLYSAASKQPVFAEPPKFAPPGSVGTGELSGNIGTTQPSGYNDPSGRGGGDRSGFSVPGGGSSAGSVTGALGGAGGSPLGTGAMTGSTRIPRNDTRAQGYQPSNNFNPLSPTSANNGPNPLTTGGMPPMMPPMMGGGGMGDDSYSGSGKGLGRGGGLGPGGGSGTGSAAGSGSAAGEGARTGIRAGGAGAAEAAGAAGAGSRGGAAGGRGASGMGGMGRGRGEGGEDEEHQRPSWLVEADPDEVFGTSERTAPPVIGE